VTGPFESAEQARATPAVRAAYAASAAAVHKRGTLAKASAAMIAAACQAAGVELGSYDRHILLDWLAGWEPEVCAAIAGVIERAAEPRLAAILAVLDRFDWEHDDRQYALEQIDRIAGGGS